MRLLTVICKNISNKIKEHCSKYYSRSVIRTKARGTEPITTHKLPKYLDYANDLRLDLLDTIDSIIHDPVEEVIMKRIMEGGYTNVDIAKELGVSREWVRREKDRLLRKLEKCLM